MSENEKFLNLKEFCFIFRLETFYANNIEIEDIYFPDSERKSKLFSNLVWLSINSNKISEVKFPVV